MKTAPGISYHIQQTAGWCYSHVDIDADIVVVAVQTAPAPGHAAVQIPLVFESEAIDVDELIVVVKRVQNDGLVKVTLIEIGQRCSGRVRPSDAVANNR